MDTNLTYTNFPRKTVVISNAISISIYFLGTLIMWKTGMIPGLLFVDYVLTLEYRLLRYHCTRCWYWGKSCGFGKGKLSALLFKKGDPALFCTRPLTWKDMIPEILVSLVPIMTGIVLLYVKFDYVILFSLIFLFVLSNKGNAYVRGTLTCRYCKQKDIGCPAAELFLENK